MDREKVFSDVLDKEEALKNYKNIFLLETQNWNFCKGVSPSFWSKIWNFFDFDFYAK